MGLAGGDGTLTRQAQTACRAIMLCRASAWQAECLGTMLDVIREGDIT